MDRPTDSRPGSESIARLIAAGHRRSQSRQRHRKSNVPKRSRALDRTREITEFPIHFTRKVRVKLFPPFFRIKENRHDRLSHDRRMLLQCPLSTQEISVSLVFSLPLSIILALSWSRFPPKKEKKIHLSRHRFFVYLFSLFCFLCVFHRYKR